MKHTNNNGVTGIIDGDILIYRSCHKALKDKIDVKLAFDNLLQDLKEDIACDNYSLHISEGGNFRKLIDQKFTVYKGKRKEKPENYVQLKDYVIKNYDCIGAHNFEADDTASIEANELLKNGKLFILATVDKDWKQIGGLFYNTHYKSLSVSDKFECIKYFHLQLLTGDSVDNVPGIYGIGPVKAEKILKDKNVIEQFDTIIETYKEYYPEDYNDRLNTMGILLYLVKSYKDPQWSIDWWKKYLKGLYE
jgi:DNA polymerase-1